LKLRRPMSGREELMSKNESLLKRRAAAVARGVSQIHPIVAERAENATVWTSMVASTSTSPAASPY
jgi:4-aminobutyrate aminotransferase-like enzyme